MVIKTKTKIKHVNKNKLIKNKYKKVKQKGGVRDIRFTTIKIPNPKGAAGDEGYIKDKDTYNLYVENFVPAIIYLTDNKKKLDKKNVIYQKTESYSDNLRTPIQALFDGLSIFNIIHSRVI